ncbi:sigma-70 family RNA polymerase sigma factor [Streptomyces sp. DSM 44917]|uniref:Sigma-70 family RNA polymerase sigma factor n=1 Tax=Streptomyces boetiae TaxID=3075541 RepID=A0ABU2L500_9ACTN|nr:sigma-70 family RNA polymerase sigma factor [Streptomyces sp. DSM 44917]MDT0306308.1 sigma-70 family RNA polymerase sigma factor [Streptomyces sp. DSM 44917]
MAESREDPASDSALLGRVREGDDGGFEELYRRHVDAVRRYARGCCPDAHTAEDVTAEVFTRTLRVVREGGGPDSAVRPYLLTMVRRAAARAGVRAELPVADLGDAAGRPAAETHSEARVISQTDRSIVVRAYLSLPERWQQVLWHTVVEREPVRRVAPRLGLTTNATAVLAFRAREGLREAYLQAHVNEALTGRDECRRHAGRLGTFARRPLLRAGYRQLRHHLDVCDRCRSAYLELVDLNETLRGLLPFALAGWLASSGVGGAAAVTKSAGLAGAGAGAGTAGAGAGAAAGAGAGAAGAGAGAGGLLGKLAVTAAVSVVAVTATAPHFAPQGPGESPARALPGAGEGAGTPPGGASSPASAPEDTGEATADDPASPEAAPAPSAGEGSAADGPTAAAGQGEDPGLLDCVAGLIGTDCPGGLVEVRIPPVLGSQDPAAGDGSGLVGGLLGGVTGGVTGDVAGTGGETAPDDVSGATDGSGGGAAREEEPALIEAELGLLGGGDGPSGGAAESPTGEPSPSGTR